MFAGYLLVASSSSLAICLSLVVPQLAPDLQGRQQRAAREEAVGQRAVSAAAGDAQKAPRCWDGTMGPCWLGRNHPVICF